MNDAPVKQYMITFGVVDVNIPALVQYLYDSADVIAYWNYVPLVYCIKSRLSATGLREKLQVFFPNGNFLIAEINPLNSDGHLPRAAWEWFYLNHHEKLRAPLPPWNSLSGLGTTPQLGDLIQGYLSPPKK